MIDCLTRYEVHALVASFLGYLPVVPHCHVVCLRWTLSRSIGQHDEPCLSPVKKLVLGHAFPQQHTTLIWLAK
jgi:hypothetical protein